MFDCEIGQDNLLVFYDKQKYILLKVFAGMEY